MYGYYSGCFPEAPRGLLEEHVAGDRGYQVSRGTTVRHGEIGDGLPNGRAGVREGQRSCVESAIAVGGLGVHRHGGACRRRAQDVHRAGHGAIGLLAVEVRAIRRRAEIVPKLVPACGRARAVPDVVEGVLELLPGGQDPVRPLLGSGNDLALGVIGVIPPAAVRQSGR